MLKVSIVFNIVFIFIIMMFLFAVDKIPLERLTYSKMNLLCKRINDVIFISSSENVPTNIDEFLDITKMSKCDLYDARGRPFDIKIYTSYMTIKSYPYGDKNFFFCYDSGVDNNNMFDGLIFRIGFGAELNNIEEYENRISRMNSIFQEYYDKGDCSYFDH